MDLNAQPFNLEVEFLLQLFDKALADEAEWSYIVGKNPDIYTHAAPFPCGNSAIGDSS